MNIDLKDIFLLLAQIVIGEVLAQSSPENRRKLVRLLTLIVILITIFAMIMPIGKQDGSTATAIPESTIKTNAPKNNNPQVVNKGNVPVVIIPETCFYTGLSQISINELCSKFKCNNYIGNENDSLYQQVCIPAFLIDQYEATAYLYSNGGFSLEDVPIANVTWYEAHSLCVSRGGDLPTEQQWELAARGQNSNIFASYLTISSNQHRIVPIRDTSKDSSWANVYGLSANVREWVRATNVSNPDFQVIKGAGFLTEDTLDMRLSLRDLELFDTKSPDVGFRCVFDVN